MFNLNRLSFDDPINESTLSLADSFKDSDGSDHSYFIETLDFLSSLERESIENDRVLYRGLCESCGSQDIIEESFSDWVTSFKNIIKKVIDFLHALLNKFLVGLNMFIKREGYLKKHKDDFHKFDENHKFHMSVYNFTLDNNIPQDSVLREFDDMFDDNDPRNTWGTDNSKASDAIKINAVTNAYDEFIKSLNNGDYYDKIRADLLGESGVVDASDFAKELFDKFRDGGTKEDKEFESGDISEAYTRFDSYEKIKKDITKKKNEVEKEYKRIAKDIESSVKKDGEKLHLDSKYMNKGLDAKDITVGADVAAKYELLIKAKANAIHEISNLHTMAFSARLDAYKDQFNQDKTILYKALYRIMGNIKTGKRSTNS